MAETQRVEASVWEEVFHHVPYGCLLLDLHGIIRAANPAALTLLSLSSAPLDDRPFLEIVPGWHDTPFTQALAQCLNGHRPATTGLFDLPLPNERWVRVGLSACSPSGVGGVLVTITDVTEMVQLKQRFRWTEYQASVGKLARGIAHELNNPLDGVLRYTHLALEQLAEDSPVREYLVHVKEGLDRMVRSAKAFLEFSRQASMPVIRQADMNQLVEDALLLMRHRIRFQQIRLLKQLEASLPSIQDSGLQHAVVNVLKNALDAMPRGGTLRIATRRANGIVELEVEDTGSGIPDTIKRRLFEPFFSTKPLHRGSGLGLAIAKEAVERSGGTLTFTSREGIGSVFRIESPINFASQNLSNGGTPGLPGTPPQQTRNHV